VETGHGLIVVAQEFPFPPNHGGRADVWRRLLVLKSMGLRIALCTWFDDTAQSRPSTTDMHAVEAIVDLLIMTPKRRGPKNDLKRLVRIATGTPSHVAARALSRRALIMASSQLSAFNADALLLDSPYGGLLARYICNELHLPMLYRSHNIEHLYFRSQAKAASDLRNRLAWRLACMHLADFERTMMDAAVMCFDISSDDADYWRAQGITHIQWLPPLPEAALALNVPILAAMDEARELAFLGNLHAPNNVRGVTWLVEEVMPRVWRQRPDTILTLAGSRPTEAVRALVAKEPRVRLCEDIDDAPAFLASTRVLVNPVQSGSGVNVKTLDMLMTDRPIVSTPQGVAGLSPAIKNQCRVAISAEQFANNIASCLECADIDVVARCAARTAFSPESLGNLIDLVRQIGKTTRIGTSNKSTREPTV
jgi:hypothetical protein